MVAGVFWFAGAYWRFEAKQTGMGVMHIAIGALNISVGAMFFVYA